MCFVGWRGVEGRRRDSGGGHLRKTREREREERGERLCEPVERERGVRCGGWVGPGLIIRGIIMRRGREGLSYKKNFKDK